MLLRRKRRSGGVWTFERLGTSTAFTIVSDLQHSQLSAPAVGGGASGLTEDCCSSCSFADAGTDGEFGIGVVTEPLSPRSSTQSTDALMADPVTFLVPRLRISPLPDW